MKLSKKEQLLEAVHTKLAEIMIENTEVSSSGFAMKNPGIAEACQEIKEVLTENSTQEERDKVRVRMEDPKNKLWKKSN